MTIAGYDCFRHDTKLLSNYEVYSNNRYMIKKTIAAVITLAIIAVTTYHAFGYTQDLSQKVGDLDLTCGFTDDFSNFIKQKGYSLWNFDRLDIKCGAYGGKASSTQKIVKRPIVFIHGNSDVGFGRGTTDGYSSWQTGFRDLATFFGSQGYKKSELYTTTWGTANILQANTNNHKKGYVLQMRAFIEAVLAYTQAPQIDIISHSMGVTIGRRIVQGGFAEDQHEGKYNVGDSLKNRVKNFVGLAGGNRGLTACVGEFLIPTCSNVDGFNPGTLPTSGPSKYLQALNASPAAEGKHVYVIWSRFDEVIGGDCVVWGKVTCRIPGQKDQIVKGSVEWGHMALRDKTGPEILKWFEQ